MTFGVGEFSKVASNAYNALSASDREALKECGSGTLKAEMTKREIIKCGARKFLKIQKLVSMCMHTPKICEHARLDIMFGWCSFGNCGLFGHLECFSNSGSLALGSHLTVGV